MPCHRQRSLKGPDSVAENPLPMRSSRVERAAEAASKALAEFTQRKNLAKEKAKQIREQRRSGRNDGEPRAESPTSDRQSPNGSTIDARLERLEVECNALRGDNSKLSATVRRLTQRVQDLESGQSVPGELVRSGQVAAMQHNATTSQAAYDRFDHDPHEAYAQRSSVNVEQDWEKPDMDFSLDSASLDAPPPPRSLRTKKKKDPPVKEMQQTRFIPPLQRSLKLTDRLNDLPISANLTPGQQPIATPPDEYPTLQEPMRSCRCCDRSFRQSLLQRHESICQKVHSKAKRPTFKVNILSDEDIKDIRKKHPTASKPAAKGGQPPQSKWRQDRAMLRRALMSSNEPVVDSRVPCPYCSRMFSEQAAERHVPMCKKTVHKPTMLLRTGRY